MPLWTLPSRRGQSWSVPSTSQSAIAGTNITAGATPHVKTSWVQLTSSTGSSDWLGFWLYYDTTSVAATNTSTLIDIGVGAAASEVVIVANLPIGYTSGALNTNSIWLPLYIPSGTRVAARTQSAVANQVEKVTVVGNNSGRGLFSDNDLYGYCTTYGPDTSTSQGVSITTGTADNYGSATQITSATTAPINAALIRFQLAGATVVNSTSWRYALYGGGSGSEVARTNDYYFATTTSENYDTRGQGAHAAPVEGLSIPTGERLSIKLASHTTTQTADFAIIGFTR